MNRNRVILASALLVLMVALIACDSVIPPAQTVAPTAGVAPVTQPPQSTAPKPTAPAVATPKGTPLPAATATVLAKGALTCPATAPLPANAQLAARVNGVGIPLDAYNRQSAQAQAALTQSGGLDLKTSAGQDTLKSLKQQVLDQMINDVVVSMQADHEGIKVTDDDLNVRLAQMIQDAGSVDNLNAYLSKNQLSLGDLCSQVRNQLLGEAMLNRVTAAIPTNAEQVHALHILVATSQTADAVRQQLVAGKDFAALAKQYSQDEASKANGGDLGWFPKGVMDPNFETVAFQLKIGEISQVVQTQFGFHIIKVLEHDNSRPLPPEVIQNKRQTAFLAWLQAVRDTLKVDRLVQP